MQKENFKLAVFSAAPFEVQPLLAVLTEQSRDFVYSAVGIGAIAAAKREELIARQCDGRHAIFVGTCGAFDEFSAPQLVTAKEVVWLPACERAGLSYPVPGSAPAITMSEPGPFAVNLPAFVVLCAPNVSLSSMLPGSYSPSKCVENIELYSCVGQLLESALSVSVILCTTNAVGTDAHSQWKSNFNKAAELTADFVRKSI
jgi:hypothetical protein